MLGILKALLVNSNSGIAPTPEELKPFESKYKSSLENYKESVPHPDMKRYNSDYNMLMFKGNDGLCTRVRQETFFEHYDIQSKEATLYPCTLEYQLDEHSGYPNSVTVITNFGKAEIGGFVENENRIPLPTKISFKAHNFLSKLIDYKHPLSVRARIKIPELGERKQIDPLYQEPYDEKYDPEEALKQAGPYNPEEAFLQEREANGESQEADSNVAFVEEPKSVEDESNIFSFSNMFRFYMIGKIHTIPNDFPYLRKHVDTDGEISYGPELDCKDIRSQECVYEHLTEGAINGMWIRVTDGNSEVDPRANFEETMLQFHLQCFFQCFSKSMNQIKDLNDEFKSFRGN